MINYAERELATDRGSRGSWWCLVRALQYLLVAEEEIRAILNFHLPILRVCAFPVFTGKFRFGNKITIRFLAGDTW